MRFSLSLIKNVLIQLDKNILLQLGFTSVASGTDTANQNKIHETGTTKLIISNTEMKDIIKIVISLEESFFFFFFFW